MRLTLIIIKEINSSDLKSEICESILRKLPNWFGIESSIIEYVNVTKQMHFYAAYDLDSDNDKAIGFVAIKVHNNYTSEVYVMGILSDYHGRGIGKNLISKCEQFCCENKMEFLTVKTLDESSESKSYEKTRKFYLAVGFKPIEVFATLWDESNPCLFMAKHI